MAKFITTGLRLFCRRGTIAVIALVVCAAIGWPGRGLALARTDTEAVSASESALEAAPVADDGASESLSVLADASPTSPVPLPPPGAPPLAVQTPYSALMGLYSGTLTTIGAAQRALYDKLGLNVHGLLAGTYENNFNYPYTGNNLFRAYDYFGANRFEMIQGELHIDRMWKNSFGVVLDLNTFNTALVQRGLTSWINEPSQGPWRPGDFLDPTQAYLTYTLPIGNGLQVFAGKFYGPIGYEIIPDWQNRNLFESIGILFNLGEPFTVTGLRAVYPVSDQLTLMLGVNSGWDTIASNDFLNNVEGRIAFTPVGWFSYTLNGMAGPTQPYNTAKRWMVDNIFTILPPIDGLMVTEEVYYARQYGPATAIAPLLYELERTPTGPVAYNPIAQAYPSGVIPHAVDWYGAGTWISYDLTKRLQLGLRGEWLDDAGGYRTGFPQQLWEITVGANYALTEHLMLRWEYRHDESNARIFPASKAPIYLPSCQCPVGATLYGMDTMLWTAMVTF